MKSKPATRIVFEGNAIPDDQLCVRFIFTDNDLLNAVWLEDLSSQKGWEEAEKIGCDSDTVGYSSMLDGETMTKLLSDIYDITALAGEEGDHYRRGRPLVLFELSGQFNAELGFDGEVREVLDLRTLERLHGREKFHWDNEDYRSPIDEDDEP